MFKRNKNKIIELILLITIPSFVFLLVTGGRIISPYYTYWISQVYSSDIQQHWLCWLYFSHTPLFQFPLFDNPNYGTNFSSSLAANDAIPIFALLFKILNPLFTEKIQYFGIWVLSCLLLQFFFAKKILDLFIPEKSTSFILSCFFIIAPMLFHRIDLGHMGMFGHWVILASLYFILKDEMKYWVWLLLILIGLLTTPYMGVIILGMYVFKEIYISIKNTAHWRPVDLLFLEWARIVTTVVIFFVLLIVIGHDVNTSNYFTGGFGNYRFNLNSFFDPASTNWPIGSENSGAHNWSILLPDLKGNSLNTSGDYEGFSFLGLGVIVLAIYSIFIIIKNPKIVLNQNIVPLVLLGLVFLLYSLSTKIIFNETELFSYHIYFFQDKIFESIRASGRFIWPTYYLLYIGIFVLSYKNIKRNYFRFLIIFLLILQIYDSSNMFKYIKSQLNDYSKTSQINSSYYMKSDYWAEFSKKYKKIRLIPPDGYTSNIFFEVTLYGAENNIPIDSAYLARYDMRKAKKLREEAFTNLEKNNLEEDSLYFFVYYKNPELDVKTDEAWSSLRKNKLDFVDQLDGFRIYAPNFFQD